MVATLVRNADSRSTSSWRLCGSRRRRRVATTTHKRQLAEAYEGATWLGGELGLEGDLGLVTDEEEALK